jgi:hypothetical protein
MTTLALFPLALFLSAGTPVPPADTTTCQTTQASTCTTLSREALSRFVGQWEGELRVHAERGTSISYVSASNELVNNGNALLILFQGFAYANPIDGASFLTLNEETKALSGSWFDTFSCSTITLSSELTTTSQTTSQTTTSHAAAAPSTHPTITLAGIALTDQRRIQQITTFESDDRLLIQLVAMDDQNQQVPLLSLDLVKLPTGSLSAAASLRQDVNFLAQLQLSNLNTLLQGSTPTTGVQITSVDVSAE